jgi:hypothetical protein
VSRRKTGKRAKKCSSVELLSCTSRYRTQGNPLTNLLAMSGVEVGAQRRTVDGSGKIWWESCRRRARAVKVGEKGPASLGGALGRRNQSAVGWSGDRWSSIFAARKGTERKLFPQVQAHFISAQEGKSAMVPLALTAWCGGTSHEGRVLSSYTWGYGRLNKLGCYCSTGPFQYFKQLQACKIQKMYFMFSKIF